MSSEASAALEVVRARSLDRSFLDSALLNVESRSRTNALPWRGQFTPGFAELMMDTYDAREGLCVDPFMGSGTSLVEAARRGRPSFGVEVNPAAVGLAQVFSMAGSSQEERQYEVDRARTLLGSHRSEQGPEHELLLRDIEANPELHRMLVPAFLLAMGNASETNQSKSAKAFSSVRKIVESLPVEPVSCDIQLGDARHLPLADDSAGFVLTSPPYINVFNYHQNYRPAAEMLGWDVLPAARAEIGSNRKHRQNRFLTVIQYAQDMILALQEITRIARSGALIVIVVGRESRVRGTAFPNGDLLAAAVDLVGGLDFVRWQERHFVSRFGETIFEEVLTFRATGHSDRGEAAETGRQLGSELLREARVWVADTEVAREIESAIENSAEVWPSPRVHTILPSAQIA